MSLDFIEIRPRFKKETPETLDTLLLRLELLFQTGKTTIDGSIVHHHATVKIPIGDQHFWSPQLTLSFEELDTGTQIRGLYGPSTNVWLLFMFLYFFMGFVAMVLLIIGISRLNLGLTAYVLWAVPFVLGGIFVLWFAGKTGRKLGHKEMHKIHDLIKPAILTQAVDVEDW
ncbi:MAG: hypothetical protein ACI8SE_001650 [Bacteroidia bacterium]|jgi:hypothetical protein